MDVRSYSLLTATVIRKWQIPQFIYDHVVHADEFVAEPPCVAIAMLGFELVCQIHGAEEPNSPKIIDGVDANRRHEMRLCGACSADQHPISGLIHKRPIMKTAHDLVL